MKISRYIKSITIVIVVLMISCFMLIGCKQANVDDTVTLDNVNTSSILVAEGYIQSIFTEDKDLFYACFPEGVFEDDDYAFESFVNSASGTGTYLGVKYVNFNKITEENGYDSDYMKSSISLIHGIDESTISDMEIIKLQVCFDSGSSKNYDSVDVYIVVYCCSTDNLWYAYEMQNSDAEFVA